MKQKFTLIFLLLTSVVIAFAGGPTIPPPEISATPSFTSVDSLKYQLNGFDALTATGTNMFAGGCGNSTVTGVHNMGFGMPEMPSGENAPMWKITTGGYNLALGYHALQNVTTGIGNLAAGSGAGKAITTSGYNVFLGHEAGEGSTGEYNIGIGLQALQTGGASSNNVMIGRNAGTYQTLGYLTEVNHSVFIGRGVRALENGSDNEIVIGYDAIGAGDNSVTLGSDSVVLTKLNGYVGIGQGSTPVKMKVLEGTTAAAEGSAGSVAHGLTGAKIVGVSVQVFYDTNSALGSGFTTTMGAGVGLEYSWLFDATTVQVQNHTTNSENILSKPFVALVWYKE